MGAGKSTVGRSVAQRLGWPFVDLDERLTERYGPIAEQVVSHGLAAFRAREREEALSLCMSLSNDAPIVLATGGGTLLDPEVRSMLSRQFALVWLDLPLQAAAARVGDDPGRPLWDEAVKQRYEERLPLYSLAPLRLDATQPVPALVEQIVEWHCPS